MHRLRRTVPILAASLVVAAAACGDGGEPPPEEEAAAASAEAVGTPVIEVVGRDFAFVAPGEIPSGWVTFRFVNEGAEHHFFLLNRLPEGKSFEDYRTEVAPPFDSVWYALRDEGIDKAEAGTRLGRMIPEWYFTGVRQMGGAGLVAPGRDVETTIRLEPGEYVMECYVKTAEGEFHASLGMVRPLTVTATDSGGSPPEADVRATVSNSEIAIQGEPAVGEQTVAVTFEEHPEVGLGNDLHVVRLTEDTELDAVVRWMDWMNLDGLRAPAPAEFVGGTQEMPVGDTAYFTLSLQPGDYAWISESVAAPATVRRFSVE